MTEPIFALVDLAAEVHAIPGRVSAGAFVSDRLHEMSKDCDCDPATIWGSAAEPRPLYEHRNLAGQLLGPSGPIQ